MSKHKKIASLGMLSSLLVVMTGPITLVVLAKSLNSEYLGFYYTFFSIVAMQQVLEVGLSSVLKQYYSHEDAKSKIGLINISNYYNFSKVWYLMMSLAFLMLTIIIGEIMFLSYTGEIEWRIPYYSLLISSALIINQIPIKAYMDGMQKQTQLQALNIMQRLVVVTVLWGCLLSGSDLISIAISQLFSSIVMFVYLTFNKNNSVEVELNGEYNLKKTFNKLWPLLRKTSVVWILGYFYLNGFNLVSFRLLGPEITGMLGITISMARAGVSIAQSITMPQMTLYSKAIANNKVKEANGEFLKYSFIGLMILVSGYLTFLVAKDNFDFFLFNAGVDARNTIYVFSFFTIAFIISQMDNFTRCFKVELFVKIQMLNSFITPLLFCLSIHLGLSYFLLPLLGLILICVLTFQKYNYCLTHRLNLKY